MTCRVHYVNPEGRPAWKDVQAERQNAAAVLRHLFPGIKRVERVEVLGTVQAKSPAARPVVAGPRRPASDAQYQAVAHGLRTFRERLAAS